MIPRQPLPVICLGVSSWEQAWASNVHNLGKSATSATPLILNEIKCNIWCNKSATHVQHSFRTAEFKPVPSRPPGAWAGSALAKARSSETAGNQKNRSGCLGTERFLDDFGGIAVANDSFRRGNSAFSAPLRAMAFNATMKPNEITAKFVDAAYRLHTKLGPGLLESVYEVALGFELRSAV